MAYSNISLNGLLNIRKYNTSKSVEYLEFAVLSFAAVILPFMLNSSQLLAGSIVNFLLIMAAINVRGWKKIIPLIVLPSVSTLALGLLFGPITMSLIYLLPFIWAGNTLLILLVKFFYVSKRKNYFSVLTSAALCKAGLLFSAAILLINFSVIPSAFAAAMGVMQLETAIIGGLLAFPVNRAYRKYFKPESQRQ